MDFTPGHSGQPSSFQTTEALMAVCPRAYARVEGFRAWWRHPVLACAVWFLAAASAASAATDFSDYSAFGSASSTTVSTIKIGALTDSETVITANTTATGDDITNLADEDGVTLPVSLVTGASGSFTVNVTNTSGASAFLNAWIDFNGNGVLTDAGEQVAANTVIATGTSNSNKTVSFTVPATATSGKVGVRVRLTSTSTPGSTGLSGNGEVEDNLVLICPAITISPTSLPSAAVGAAFTQTLTSSGGASPYTAAQILFCKSGDQVWDGSAEFMLR